MNKNLHFAFEFFNFPKGCHANEMQQIVTFRVYNIGIEVRQGRGRYHDTNIVSFSPRYQLDNRSSYKLAFAQRHLARPVSYVVFGSHFVCLCIESVKLPSLAVAHLGLVLNINCI